MGLAFLVGRLAAADVRRHRVQAGLLLLAITAATATLTLGLALHGVTTSPYQRTRAATAGPDVVASLLNLAGRPPKPRRHAHPATHETIFSNDLRPSKRRTADLNALAHAPGVTAHSGPYPVAWVTLRAHGLTAGVAAEGRDRAAANVDRPLITHGRWVGNGDAVVEQGYADALGIHVGDVIRLSGQPFRVSGLAVTAAVPEYPSAEFAFGGDPFPHPGLIWVTRTDAQRLAALAGTLPLSYVLNLRLRDPGAANAFVDARYNLPLSLISSPSILQRDAKLITVEQIALSAGSWLLGLLAVASVAVLVGGRMTEQRRRVGLLKAVGATPAVVAAVLLVEDVVLALLAAIAGLLIGWLAAPLLTSPGAGLLGSAGSPSLTLSTVELVTAVALGVAVVATFIPAVRASRLSTVRALADAARTPRRRGTLIALSTRLPVPLLLGMRLVARRPQRAMLGAFSVAITVTTVVAVVTVHAHQTSQVFAGFSAIDNPRIDRINHAMLIVSVVLIALAAINALFITWSTAIDARHQLTVARALGASPGQISAGLAAAQLIPAIPATIAGIPAGVALVAALSHGDKTPAPGAWSLVAVVLGTLLVLAVLCTISARFGARRPVAEILQAELA